MADVIERWPQYAPALAHELQPGRGYRDIRVGEVDAAVRALNSPHVIIRRHAVGVLGERRLGPHAARRVLPLLGQAVRRDPDASVRRLAILSLLWWNKDSQYLADTIREAMDDPATEVREAAAIWLREQRADKPT